jgi:hypothetical protein
MAYEYEELYLPGGGPYRLSGDVEKDEDEIPMSITPEQATARADVKAAEKNVKRVDAASYWYQQLEPGIKNASNEGRYRSYHYGLTSEMAKQLAKHGKSLGWRVRHDNDSITVRWGPRLDAYDKRALKNLAPAATIIVITAIATVLQLLLS